MPETARLAIKVPRIPRSLPQYELDITLNGLRIERCMTAGTAGHPNFRSADSQRLTGAGFNPQDQTIQGNYAYLVSCRQLSVARRRPRFPIDPHGHMTVSRVYYAALCPDQVLSTCTHWSSHGFERE